MKKNNRETGAKAEAIACWFLKQQGYDVLEQNFYTKVGEIDIIAKEDQTLVFVEVKYRKDDKKGYPAQAVDQRKQQKIRKSAMIYLKMPGLLWSLKNTLKEKNFPSLLLSMARMFIRCRSLRIISVPLTMIKV